jgi:hypothetical protein
LIDHTYCTCIPVQAKGLFSKKIFQENAVEATKQKEEKRKKPKPEEQEGMPQRYHCPRAKRRGDRNPKCHEEQRKDVA